MKNLLRAAMAAAGLSVGHSQSLSESPVTTTGNADHTITIQWSAPSTHLYSIEWSADLQTWATAAKDYPTFGGTGVWTDTGDFFPEGPTSKFGDTGANRRFYRVRQGRELPASLPSVSLSVYSQDTGTGIITFEATPAAPSGLGVDRVWLVVDGRKVGEPAFEAPWQITLDTRKLPNGAHTAYAVAEDTRGGNTTTTDDTSDLGTGSGVAASSGVSFTTDNLISQAYSRPFQLLSPAEPQAQRFAAKLSETRSWTLTLTSNGTSSTVRTYSGSGTSVDVSWDGKDGSGADVPAGVYTATLDIQSAPLAMVAAAEGGTFGGTSISWTAIKGPLGVFGVMYQGHHPAKSYTGSPPLWQAPRRLGVLASQRLRFADQVGGYSGPWGPLRSAEGVADGFLLSLVDGGYSIGFNYANDQVTPEKLNKTGTNDFNGVNVGLLIGHSVSATDAEYGAGQLPVPQVYYPVYTASPESVDWISTVEMEFGSQNLRWLGLYTCNFFRASPYKSDPTYDALKSNGYLPMNGNLGALCGFATEVLIVPSFGELWASAMLGRRGPLNSSVVNAWGYAARITQAKISDSRDNVARVVCWESTRNDHLYGYGSQGILPGSSADTRDVIEVDFTVP
jgi:hypothetical protein